MVLFIKKIVLKIFIMMKSNIKRRVWLKSNVRLAKDAFVDLDTKFEGNNLVRSNCRIIGSEIGKGSYFSNDCYFEQSKIGRYCSIAKGVKVVAGRHPLAPFVSTSPAFYSNSLNEIGLFYGRNSEAEEYKYADNDNHVVVIGNDVWIGTDALIMEGVTIGDGAVIGAGAVVTKNVKPYSIVGGCPAKLIRLRFKSDEIAFLLKYQWWNKDDDWLKRNCQLFYDINQFIKELA